MEPSEDGGHGHAPGQGGIPISGVSLRTTKPTWSKKTGNGGTAVSVFEPVVVVGASILRFCLIRDLLVHPMVPN